MLHLRREQLDAMAQDETLWKGSLFGAMRRAYPEESERLGREGMEHRIDCALDEARDHGIEQHLDLERYLHLVFLFDTDTLASSPEAAWAEDILDWDDASEELKLAALEKHCREESLRPALH